MKEGNQFYLDFQIVDENDNLLDINSILKIQFTIGNLTKEYDGINENVIYNSEQKIFKVWLTVDETLKFVDMVNVDSRILFKGDIQNDRY